MSHLGQNRKSSMRANVFRCSLNNGHRQDTSACPFRAAGSTGRRNDVHEEINLASLEPLIAKPSSPGNVVPVREVAGQEIYQAYIGSSANPGYRDIAIAAAMVKGRQIH